MTENATGMFVGAAGWNGIGAFRKALRRSGGVAPMSVAVLVVAAWLVGESAWPQSGLPAGDVLRPASIDLAQDPRDVAALSDLTILRDAEDQVNIDTMYLTSLENLDDLPGINTLFPYQGIDDQGGAWMLDPATGGWLRNRILLDQPPHQWGGPYVTFQRMADANGAGYDPYTPLDPWGNPYLLFSPLGLARPTGPAITLEFYGDQFDRWWLISFGADGVMSGDDIGVPFGGSPTSLVASSARAQRAGQTAPAAYAGSTVSVGSPTVVGAIQSQSIPSTLWVLVIKGYNFGASQGSSTALVDGQTQADAATSWTSTLIYQPLPAGIAVGNHTAQVRVGGVATDPVPFTFSSDLTASDPRVWSLYQ